ncbi:thiamine-phosphate kinase [Gammaproteobacteria bacterium AB-CW1]|uniref:Thiamine-monophosphate kinase n=1 Tax=Natronospira elongata TaxID=3110268 RepID=A0AAP6JCR8_9GAMM|nr:thiamine-phosphate kinase [Gammaproteobacteria bacterium AB-CW1]
MSQREFELIRRLFRERVQAADDLPVGIGDDGAVLRVEAGELVWAIDTINAGVHFPTDAPAHAVGHRVLAVNLSDLVAMGATARWALLSLSLDETPDEKWLEGFCAGFFELAERAGVVLGGGDMTRGPLAASVSLLGRAGQAVVTRRGARLGDWLLVSGTLGDARAGLDIALGDDHVINEHERSLLARYLYPEPRLGLSEPLARYATSAIDLSDGLCADLGHLLRESGVGAELALDQLPLSPALRAHAAEEAPELALAGGDDYEILCTAGPDQVEALESSAQAAGLTLQRIGRIVEQRGLQIRNAEGERVSPPTGFSHFGETDA